MGVERYTFSSDVRNSRIPPGYGVLLESSTLIVGASDSDSAHPCEVPKVAVGDVVAGALRFNLSIGFAANPSFVGPRDLAALNEACLWTAQSVCNLGIVWGGPLQTWVAKGAFTTRPQ
jgi:hypothetical protein